ncbi:hypothetical protein Cadr_000000772 [Camelus dromedarius]|uniref:Uncharacterized protein n=1 Tax=Camelus dromedarius TaxID=9838 RepID=A0A5N4EKT6_CAMDR|nr:hypothetical protein Cadr_000000772 [Camelus dromedarius]
MPLHSSSYLASSTCPDPTQGTCAHPLPRSVTHQLLHDHGECVVPLLRPQQGIELVEDDTALNKDEQI